MKLYSYDALLMAVHNYNFNNPGLNINTDALLDITRSLQYIEVPDLSLIDRPVTPSSIIIRNLEEDLSNAKSVIDKVSGILTEYRNHTRVQVKQTVNNRPNYPNTVTCKEPDGKTFTTISSSEEDLT